MSSNKERMISGFRPTSDLTLGNYLGAVKPALEIQDDPSKELYIFVADLHGLTDHDPREIAPYRDEVVHDCLALGINPEKTTIYRQSDTEAEVVQIANRLSPYASVAELARTPNLKEKMQTAVRRGQSDSDDPMKANLGLLSYPVLMAADIYAQNATGVAVGEDQEPHVELARTIARRFNRRFRSGVLVEPSVFAVESLRIMALDGKGKMSKTNPSRAIMLNDDPGEARMKIKKSATASAGDWNPVIDSHFLVASRTAADQDTTAHLDELKADHLAGKLVMGEFKKVWGDITESLLSDFQERKAKIPEEQVRLIIREGGKTAAKNAGVILDNMKDVMGL